MKIEIDLGTTAVSGAGAERATLDLEELLATRLLVQGNSGSGKSHLLRRLLEQSASQVQQVVIDPEGDFTTLSERFGHVVVDGDRSTAELAVIGTRIRQHRISAVLTLESLDAEGQMRAAAAFLGALFDADRDHWFPAIVVVDEAQIFAPSAAGDVAEEVRRLSLGAMTNLMCRGRKRGLAGVIATQRLAKLAKNVAAEATNFLMGRTFLDIDMARAADLLGLERRGAELFRDLARGDFLALGPALSRRPRPIRVGDVETAPRGAIPRLLPLPRQPEGGARDLVLAPMPVAAGRPSPEPRRAAAPPSTGEILAAIDLGGCGNIEAAREPVLPAPERERMLGQIAHAIMADADAAFRPEPVLLGDLEVRCRMARLGGGPVPPAEMRLHLNAARAGLDEETRATDAWAAIRTFARTVPDDLQAVYLVLAGAALAGRPCPSDGEIARRCGMHSAGRARSRVGHLDRANTLVLRTDLSGRRVVALPGFGWETTPRDPNARDEPDGAAPAPFAAA